MNPNIDKLPVPNAAPAGIDAQSVEFGVPASAAEREPTQEAGRMAPPQATSPLQVVATGAPTAPQANPVVPTINTPTAASPISDVDPEFEKKWVSAAKSIVERTQGDPHLQSQELSKAGEEYRKRLGRRVDPNKE